MTPPRILVVDDSTSQLDWLVEVLAREGYEVRTALTGNDAIRKAKTEAPDLILLEKVLPDMDGLEVLRVVKRTSDDAFVPVIMLSARADLDAKISGLKLAEDYLTKPFAEAELLARCGAMLRIKQLQDQLRDAQQKLQDQSLTDPLTGLRNRRFFDERLREEFGRAQRYSSAVSLMMIDLDLFKNVNDDHGHQAGDTVLREAAALIRSAVREPDVCARYGGDEFAVILPMTPAPGARKVAERVWRTLGAKVYSAPLPPGAAREIRVTASIGIATFPATEATSAELLLRCADEALYRAKRAGRNAISVYQPDAEPRRNEKG